MIIASAPSLLSQVKAEKIRALAVTTVERSEVAPEIRGLKESGYPKAAVDLWWGVLAPAGTPKPVVDKLNKTINQIITSDAMKSFFVKEGASPVAMSSDAFANHLATELERWKTIAQNANIQAD
jgi:tripartite-type tricarboxylate transporter receptor subunit TctC